MALGLERVARVELRHLVARSLGRQALFPDASARAAMSARIADLCARHRLQHPHQPVSSSNRAAASFQP